MKIQLRHFSSRLLRLFQSLSPTPGFALVISLIVMLALALLGLTLLLLSNTESMISLNERDSTLALYNADGALAVIKELVVVTSAVAPDLTYLLNGADDNPLTTYDNGVMRIKSLNPSITRNDLNNDCSEGSTTCEAWTSVIENVDGVPYEVYRVGVDRDGSTPADESGWDGPRGLVYVRVDDNHDDEPYPNDSTTDKDKRVNITILSQYPILVDAAGIEVEPNSVTLRTVGVSRRKLVARFGPSTPQPALITDGNMLIEGNLDVCGNCGGVHANGLLTIGGSDVDLCRDATASAAPPIRNDGGTFQTVGGVVEQVEPLEIPVANPFHEDFVPSPLWFKTHLDKELKDYKPLKCPRFDLTYNPGGTKYFAFVGDGATGRIFKAYWRRDLTPPQWKWELIDILKDGFNPILDDCGRLVDDGAGGAIHASDTNAALSPNLPINDMSDNHFYDFKYTAGSGTAVTCIASDDKTLSGIADNDYGKVSRVPVIPGVTYMLPGTSGPRVENNSNYKDGIADFIPANAMDQNDHEWKKTGNDVWSPLYNAVIFVYGNLKLQGSPSSLCYSDDPPPSCRTALPAGMWRATFIAFNNINTGSQPAYGAFRSHEELANFQYLFVAGRDIELAGSTGSFNICPGGCSEVPTAVAGYTGLILAHEQIRIGSNTTLNAVVMSEDAATCSPLAEGYGLEASSGSPQVYYDCVHPPTPFERSGLLKSWEEIQ